jgi:branched-chain amino acid transport system substrate-binding protein
MTPSLGTCGPGVLDDIKRHGMKVVIDDQLPPQLNDMSALHVYVPMLALTHCNSAQIAEKLGGSCRGPSHNGRRWLWARAG